MNNSTSLILCLVDPSVVSQGSDKSFFRYKIIIINRSFTTVVSLALYNLSPTLLLSLLANPSHILRLYKPPNTRVPSWRPRMIHQHVPPILKRLPTLPRHLTHTALLPKSHHGLPTSPNFRRLYHKRNHRTRLTDYLTPADPKGCFKLAFDKLAHSS